MKIKKGMTQYQVQNLVDQLERRRDAIINQQLEVTVDELVNDVLVTILVATDEEYVNSELKAHYESMRDEMNRKEDDHHEN